MQIFSIYFRHCFIWYTVVQLSVSNFRIFRAVCSRKNDHHFLFAIFSNLSVVCTRHNKDESSGAA